MESADPGSFRDPASRVIHDQGRVIRLLDERGRQAWDAVSGSDFYQRAVAAGDVIDSQSIKVLSDWDAAGALEHPRLPFISYPYEWTFSMLKDAALLQLDLLEQALASGITIKDATPFNIQFDLGRPVFIDIGSFEEYRSGEAWLGYRQFTRQFLFPLLMRAWVDLPFQPWLRGDMEGPTAVEMRQMLKGRKRFSTAALLHVRLQARMEVKHSGQAVRDNLGSAGFSADMILTNVRRLRKLVDSLDWSPEQPGWSGYRECSHVERDRDSKTTFLRTVIGDSPPGTMLDLGANDGHFSLVAAGTGTHAIAVDGDGAVLDRLYKSARGSNVSVVLSDLVNSSPSQGWAGTERPGLFDRARPDLVVAYGLIHHLIYSASVPPKKVLEWLRNFNAPVALEFVAPDDEMVMVLTANKRDHELHPGRDQVEFLRMLKELFDVRSETTLGEGSRTLYHLIPR